MKSTLPVICFCLVLCASLFTTSRQALATLGEGADSIPKDSKALSARKQALAATTEKYTVQEVRTDANTVREYLSTSGVVFAVAWNGMAPPDLTALLGSYAAEFRDAKRLAPRDRGSKKMKVVSERVVVESWGHMRNLQGRAYLPALVPEGVSVDEIK